MARGYLGAAQLRLGDVEEEEERLPRHRRAHERQVLARQAHPRSRAPRVENGRRASKDDARGRRVVGRGDPNSGAASGTSGSGAPYCTYPERFGPASYLLTYPPPALRAASGRPLTYLLTPQRFGRPPAARLLTYPPTVTGLLLPKPSLNETLTPR